jgi:hypothetical protein
MFLALPFAIGFYLLSSTPLLTLWAFLDKCNKLSVIFTHAYYALTDSRCFGLDGLALSPGKADFATKAPSCVGLTGRWALRFIDDVESVSLNTTSNVALAFR